MYPCSTLFTEFSDQLELGKKKIHSQFLISLIIYIVDITKSYELNTTIIHKKMANNNNRKGGDGISVFF